MNPLTARRTRAERQPQQSVRVLVVDDQPLFAEAISVLLKLNEGIEVVGTAADGQEAVDRAIARSTASCPSAAVPTTSIPSFSLRSTEIASAKSGWSSTTSTRTDCCGC